MSVPLTSEARLKAMKDFIKTEAFLEIRKNYTANMSRAERREYERREEKLTKCISALTPVHYEIIDQLSDIKMTKKLDEMTYIMDRSVTALIGEIFPEKTWEELSEIEDILGNLITEDIEKYEKIKNECRGDINMINKKVEKIQNEVNSKVKELLGKQLKQKEIIDILVTQFPTLSKSMLTNEYKKIKSAWDKEHEKEEDPAVEEAMEKISEILEESQEKEEAEKVTKEKLEDWDKKYNSDGKLAAEVKVIEQETKVVCNGNSCSIEPVENKEIENKEEATVKGLKVLEEKVIKTIKVQGENGIYEGKTGEGIVLIKDNASVRFNTVKELEDWTEEFKEVFARLNQ